jgi:hypothetical protein
VPLFEQRAVNAAGGAAEAEAEELAWLMEATNYRTPDQFTELPSPQLPRSHLTPVSPSPLSLSAHRSSLKSGLDSDEDSSLSRPSLSPVPRSFPIISTTAEDDDKADQQDQIGIERDIKLMLLSVSNPQSGALPLLSSLQDPEISDHHDVDSPSVSDAPTSKSAANLIQQRSFANAIQLFPPLGMGTNSGGLGASTWGSLDSVSGNGPWS